MRIYDGDFTVGRLIEDCSTTTRRMSELPVQGHEQTPEIDIGLLNQRLNELPIAEIRRRRQRMNTFYEEVLVSSDPDRGIQFTSLLLILAHHKVINDNKSLRYDSGYDLIGPMADLVTDWKNSCVAEPGCNALRKLSGATSLSVSLIHYTGHDDSDAL